MKIKPKVMNKKLKVLFLASSYPSKINKFGGIFVKRHAEAVSIYCDVCVLSIVKNELIEEGKTEVEIDNINGIKTITLYYHTKKITKFLSYIHKLFFYIKYHLSGYKYVLKNFGKPDLVHVNIIYPIGIFGVFLRLFKNIPYIITEHRSYYLEEFKNSDYRRLFSRRILSRISVFFASYITTVSKRVMNAMIGCGLKGDYEVTPNVYSEKNFFPSTPSLRSDKFKLIHVSLLGEGKNIEGILKVLNKIKDHHDFIFYIVGDGENRDRLEQIARKYGLSGNYVLFTGAKEEKELGNLLRESDCLIMFSWYENFPCVIIEAFASGIPVISSDVGGISEHINSQTGLIVAPGSKEELCNALEFIIRNPEKFNKKTISKFAENRFSYKIVGKQFEKIYLKVLGIMN